MSPPAPEPAPPPPARRRRSAFLAAFVLLAALAAAGGWRWHHVTRPDYRLARGVEAVRTEDWPAAERHLAGLERAGAGDHAALLRGELLQARGRPDLAASAYAEVGPDSPLHVRAAAAAGKCLIDFGALAAADHTLRAVVARDPGHVDAHRGLAAVAYDLGHLSAAVEYLEAVARLDPADPRPHRLVGLIYKDMSFPEKAEAAYREALRRGLGGAARGEVAVELADTLVATQKYDAALAVLDADAGAPGADLVRVSALRGAGRAGEAAALAEALRAARPGEAPFHRLRGQLHLDAGETGPAVAALREAARLAPNHYQTHFLLAQALAADSQPAAAAPVQARADELLKDMQLASALTREAMDKPWDARVRQQLADAHERMGDAKLAAMWRAAAAAVRPR